MVGIHIHGLGQLSDQLLDQRERQTIDVGSFAVGYPERGARAGNHCSHERRSQTRYNLQWPGVSSHVGWLCRGRLASGSRDLLPGFPGIDIMITEWGENGVGIIAVDRIYRPTRASRQPQQSHLSTHHNGRQSRHQRVSALSRALTAIDLALVSVCLCVASFRFVA